MGEAEGGLEGTDVGSSTGDMLGEPLGTDVGLSLGEVLGLWPDLAVRLELFACSHCSGSATL